MKIIFMLLCLVFICPANNSIIITSNESTNKLHWSRSNAPTTLPFEITPDAAIGGESGILFRINAENSYKFTAKGPLFKETWLSFSLRVDEWPLNTDSTKEFYIRDFITLSISEPIRNAQPEKFAYFSLFSIGKSLFLGVRLRYSIETGNIDTFLSPVELSIPITTDLEIAQEADDIISTSLFVNGIKQGTIRKKYPFAKEFAELTLLSFRRVDIETISLALDEFIISDKRAEKPLPPPINCKESTANGKITLFCEMPRLEKNHNITHKATCWILHSTDELLQHPLYMSEEVDTTFLFKRTVPFKLDSGNYSWSCYFKNRDGVSGAQANRRNFFLPVSETSNSLKITDAYPSLTDTKARPDTISPGKWYDWHIKTENSFNHKNISYWILAISHPDYPFGHPANKFGAYICSLNSVYNISMKGDGGWLLYEKKDNGSLKSIRVPSGTKGHLIDDSPGAFSISHEKGELSFRAFLPVEALEGEWTVAAYAVDTNETNTNIFRRKINVKKSSATIISDKKQTKSLIISAIIIATIATVVAAVRRKKKTEPASDPLFIQIREYVSANMDKEHSLKSIAANRAVSVKTVQDALKRNGIKTIPAFINILRIEKALKLLSTPNLTVAEIAYSVGFDDSEYFSKVFREITGQTPSDYRKKTAF